MSNINTVEDYLSLLTPDRKMMIDDLLSSIESTLPDGFEKTIGYGMIAFVVPHSLYPKGYHCDTKQPLPFISIASQKNFVSLYHMGLYAEESLLEWFQERYKMLINKKIDMGKSCIRFKKYEDIPFELIKELSSKFTPQDWIQKYESKFLTK